MFLNFIFDGLISSYNRGDSVLNFIFRGDGGDGCDGGDGGAGGDNSGPELQ